ncbi:MAG: hypothetical protein GEU79_17110 [Acidimicrobiia bacterium]|nr:hypothetical protein [Acidimicrobiia bacterium]
MWRQRSISSLVLALGASLTLSGVIISTGDGSDLGAPSYWPWLLTGLQVTALWSAGTRRWWGWLLGSSVQIPWVAYAVVTTQIGFIPGCAVSLLVQSYSFVRQQAQAPARAPTFTSRRDLGVGLQGGQP